MVRTKTMRVQGGKAPRRQMATKSNDIDVFSAETVAITGIMTPAQIREQNIRENMQMLEELGVMQSVRELEKSVIAVANSKKRQSVPSDGPAKAKRARKLEVVDENQLERRRSNRLSNMPPRQYVNMDEGDGPDKDRSNNRRKLSHSSAAVGVRGEKTCTDKSEYRFMKPPANRPHTVGAIAGIDVGYVFHSREEASYAGVHRGLVAGISGNDKQIYSICLNGGYEDDIDLGDRLCYTGAGGRDLKGTAQKPKNCRTAPQSKDQTLTGTNAGLFNNLATKMPVRVLRGYKLHSKYAPDYGYRYDGLYEVVKHKVQMGQAGFLVQRFFLQRIAGQPSLIERSEDAVESENDEENLHEMQEDALEQEKEQE